VANSMNIHAGWTNTELRPGTAISTPSIFTQNFIMILLSYVQLNILQYISRGLPYYRLQCIQIWRSNAKCRWCPFHLRRSYKSYVNIIAV